MGPASRRRSESAINAGASKSTRNDFEAAAMTPPVPPIWVPTAMAEDRSFTASPAQSPAIVGWTPSQTAIGWKAMSAVRLNSEITAMAVACSSRCAFTTGATAFTAEAPQIIVPAASRSAIGRRRPIAAPRRWVTKNVLGSATAATPATSNISPRAKKPVWTLRPMRTMASRSTHFPVYRRPGA